MSLDLIASAFDFFAAIMLALIASWAVMSPRVQDGVIIKLGLIFVALGAGGLASALYDGLDSTDIHVLSHATLMLNVGLLVIVIGAVARLRSPGKKRRVSDWIPLDGDSGAQR